ncbi:MAG: alpha-galactosidase [Candidatus Omnitrophica bacterium]|nr:alpha-galactosidase [Candidatus Omnitrophota bacterium]
MKAKSIIKTLVSLIATVQLAQAVVPTSEEMAESGRWFDARFIGAGSTNLPFSFVYGGRPSLELLPGWKLQRSETELDGQRTRLTLVFSDDQTGLEVRCEAIKYRDFPAAEWTLYFKNCGIADTAILEKIQVLDGRWEREAKGEFLLHHNVGSPANGSDYAPLETPLEPGAAKRISAAGGRPTNTDLSYFNLEWNGRGVILAVGWPGQWAAEFARDKAAGIQIRAGQELTHFKLLPGEEVRSPLIVALFWKGDWIRGQNLWRRWMMAHGMPKPGGKLPPPQMLGSSFRVYEEMTKADEASQIMFINRYIEEGLKLDYWWMDAGWYVSRGGWGNTGTWEVEPKRFPNGFKPISDHAHANGIKILVWFEPERVTAGSWLADQHPEWILGGKNGGLLDLGNREAWTWLVNHIDKLLVDNGIDLYRQDFNMDPLGYWRANDAADRQGITEIKHVTGYLAYWDELLRRHPNMLIDSCASGGRRNDLETMRRAVPLWRSDYAFEPIGTQCITYGISLWLPYHGTGTVAARSAGYYGSGFTAVDPYGFWSNLAPSISCACDMRAKNLDYPALRRLFGYWRRINPDYYGDYYPLTSWSKANDVWMAWQFDRPEAGEGVVQAFRRENSIYESARFKLNGLEADARYRVTVLDGPEPREFAGSDLMKKGLPVTMEDKPAAATIIYQRIIE